MSHFLHLSIFVITSCSFGAVAYANINKCIDIKSKKITFTDAKCRPSDLASVITVSDNTIDNSGSRKVVNDLSFENLEHVPHFITMGAK